MILAIIAALLIVILGIQVWTIYKAVTVSETTAAILAGMMLLLVECEDEEEYELDDSG